MTSPFTPTFKRPQQLRVQHLNDLLPSAKVLSFLNLYPSLNIWFVSVRIVIFSIASVRLCPRILQLRAFIHARSLYHSFLRAARIPFLRAAIPARGLYLILSRRAQPVSARSLYRTLLLVMRSKFLRAAFNAHSCAPRAAHQCAHSVPPILARRAQLINTRKL